MFKIYGLFDPQTRELKYIGFTRRILLKRLSEHLTPSSLKYITHKNNWIKSLLNKKLKPEIFELQETDEANWEFDEEWNRQYFLSIGCNLTNNGVCGKGRKNYKTSKNTREKMRQTHLGYKYSEKARKNMKTAQENLSEEIKNKKTEFIKNLNKGKHLSTKIKRSISKSKKGKDPWNKNRTGVYSKEVINKMKNSRKATVASRNVEKEIQIRLSTMSLTRKQIIVIYKRRIETKDSYAKLSKFFNVSTMVTYRAVKFYKEFLCRL